MVTGVIVTGFGISASFLIFIAEGIINPNGDHPTIEYKNVKYYNEEISLKLRTYLMTSIITFACFAVAGALMIIPHKKTETEQAEKFGVLVESDTTDIGEEMCFKEMFFMALKSPIFWMTWAMILCGSCKFVYLIKFMDILF